MQSCLLGLFSWKALNQCNFPASWSTPCQKCLATMASQRGSTTQWKAYALFSNFFIPPKDKQMAWSKVRGKLCLQRARQYFRHEKTWTSKTLLLWMDIYIPKLLLPTNMYENFTLNCVFSQYSTSTIRLRQFLPHNPRNTLSTVRLISYFTQGTHISVTYSQF